MMRVYQINTVCGIGSTGRIAADLGRAIAERGGECRIAYGRGKCLSGEIDNVNISSKADMYTHAILTRVTDRHGLFSRKATERLIRDIEGYAPDLVHLHNLHGYYLNYEMLFQFLEGYGKPVVWTMHDCWAFTGHCAHYDAAGCGKWETGCCNCPALRSYPSSVYGGNVADNYDRKKRSFTSVPNTTIVTPSHWLENQVKRSFLRETDCVTIPNGIDLARFVPMRSNLRRKLGCEDKRLLLGVASVWTKNKGLEDFVRLRDMLDSRYAICMIGLTKKQMRMLPAGIIGKMRTESVRELTEYYSAADVFLNLTYEDTFPTTNIEALACGTPVVTYDTGGSPEILSDGCGYVLRKGDLEAVISSLRDGLPEKRICRNTCLERAARFDKKRCYGKYLDLYDQIEETK